MQTIQVGQRIIGSDNPVYFIADIGANHDGELARGVDLIHLAAEAGADAAKFQNFQAPKIVSDYGFKALGGQLSHQAEWKKSVFEVYQDASIPFDWTPELKQACDEAGIDYFSSPYDFEAIDMLEDFVPAYKAGSGLITWIEALEYMAAKGKPMIVSTGACDLSDVIRAVRRVLAIQPELVLMQCNTNYTGSRENFEHVHLRVLHTYLQIFPDVAVGFSDHTPGHSAVLGAVALGARSVEKHFTDDTTREGPDHPFAMDPTTWREMVDRTRELEAALGSPDKFIAGNERETQILQRRCLRAARDIHEGEQLTREMIDILRPNPTGAIQPYEIEAALGLTLLKDIPAGEALRWDLLGE
ncbi:MAG: N-acetylneuraminate synthase family protein [Anaerolineales bacterium]